MRCAIAILVAAGLLSGCSQNPYLDANIELMNAERRGLEDRLYELEYEYESKIEELERLRQENAALRDRLGSPAGTRRAAPRRQPDSMVDPPPSGDDDLTIPEIVLPAPTEGAAGPPPSARPPSAPTAGPGVLDQEITHLVLKQRSLSGVDFDEVPGDDGLAIVVEPRNAADDIVSLPAPISVVVLDIACQGAADAGTKAQVARWDLTAADVRRFLQDSPANEGIAMHLLWPERPPEHERLRVFVRYEGDNGRRFQTEGDVRIHLAPKLSQRWTPRTGPAAELPSLAPVERSEPIALPQWSPYR